jgi:hypothetical protein
MDGEQIVCPGCGSTTDRRNLFCPACGEGLADARVTADTDCREIPWKIRTQIHELLVSRRYIEAVRLFRENTGLPLKQAKEAVDAYAAGNGIEGCPRGASPLRCLGVVAGFFIWMAFIGVLPFAVQRFAPLMFGPEMSPDEIETCMAVVPMAAVLLSLAVFFLLLYRRGRSRGAGENGS